MRLNLLATLASLLSSLTTTTTTAMSSYDELKQTLKAASKSADWKELLRSGKAAKEGAYDTGKVSKVHHHPLEAFVKATPTAYFDNSGICSTVLGCDPRSNKPCCSPFGFCGNDNNHCVCPLTEVDQNTPPRACVDYRKNSTSVFPEGYVSSWRSGAGNALPIRLFWKFSRLQVVLNFSFTAVKEASAPLLFEIEGSADADCHNSTKANWVKIYKGSTKRTGTIHLGHLMLAYCLGFLIEKTKNGKASMEDVKMWYVDLPVDRLRQLLTNRPTPPPLTHTATVTTHPALSTTMEEAEHYLPVKPTIPPRRSNPLVAILVGSCTAIISGILFACYLSGKLVCNRDGGEPSDLNVSAAAGGGGRFSRSFGGTKRKAGVTYRRLNDATMEEARHATKDDTKSKTEDPHLYDFSPVAPVGRSHHRDCLLFDGRCGYVSSMSIGGSSPRRLHLPYPVNAEGDSNGRHGEDFVVDRSLSGSDYRFHPRASRALCLHAHVPTSDACPYSKHAVHATCAYSSPPLHSPCHFSHHAFHDSCQMANDSPPPSPCPYAHYSPSNVLCPYAHQSPPNVSCPYAHQSSASGPYRYANRTYSGDDCSYPDRFSSSTLDAACVCGALPALNITASAFPYSSTVLDSSFSALDPSSSALGASPPALNKSRSAFDPSSPSLAPSSTGEFPSPRRTRDVYSASGASVFSGVSGSGFSGSGCDKADGPGNVMSSGPETVTPSRVHSDSPESDEAVESDQDEEDDVTEPESSVGTTQSSNTELPMGLAVSQDSNEEPVGFSYSLDEALTFVDSLDEALSSAVEALNPLSRVANTLSSTEILDTSPSGAEESSTSPIGLMDSLCCSIDVEHASSSGQDLEPLSSATDTTVEWRPPNVKLRKVEDSPHGTTRPPIEEEEPELIQVLQRRASRSEVPAHGPDE